MKPINPLPKGTYLVFNDSFGVKHIGITTGPINDITVDKRVLGVIILKSLEKSQLNTANILYSDIELILEGEWDSERIEGIETEMPEIWI